MKDRIFEFLSGRGGGASAEEIAAEVLRLQGAKGAVADKIVVAATDGDGRFARGRDGVWTLRRAKVETPLRATMFTALSLRMSGREVGVFAGYRFGMSGPGEGFPGTRMDAGEMRGEISGFAAFSAGAIPVGFRMPRLRSAFNRTARRVLGRPVIEEGICLYRLGRRMFPDRSLPSLEALALATGLSYTVGPGTGDEAALLAEICLFLMERCEAQGVRTVEGVLADCYPDPMPVHFEAYAFDRAFLDELPQSAGVYIMRDQAGQVIYVGKAVRLRDRVRSYFARRSERPEKTRKILERIWSMEVETVGSELEALLLEARLIRLCTPEFNTQVAVHEQDGAFGPEKDFVLLLPSSEPECVELFCVREGRPIRQVRVRRDFSDWEWGAQAVSGVFYEDAGAAPSEDAEDADLVILKRWLGQRRHEVSVVDVGRAEGRADVLRLLQESIRDCDPDAGERVWRV